MKVLRWLYDWITVLTASLVGVPTLLLQILPFFMDIDLTPYVGPERALQIVTAVAILKAVMATIETLMREPE